MSQEWPARAGVCWQELPPPGGELTAPADGYDCHTMAPRAITHNLSVRPPSPFLTASMGLGCYNLLLKRDRLCVFAALIRVSFDAKGVPVKFQALSMTMLIALL